MVWSRGGTGRGDTPPADSHCAGGKHSYWNAFCFSLFMFIFIRKTGIENVYAVLFTAYYKQNAMAR